MSLFPRRSVPLRSGLVVAGSLIAAVVTGCGTSGPVLQSTDDTVTTVNVAAPPGPDASPSEDTTDTPTADDTDPTTPGDPVPDGVTDTDGDAATPEIDVADPPLEPTGPFVNTHRFSLDGNDAPGAGQSICRTSPGATCTVSFLTGAGDVAASLDPQTVPAQGVVSWDWSPARIGLGAGSYEIEVTATRGDHEIVVRDASELIVVN